MNRYCRKMSKHRIIIILYLLLTQIIVLSASEAAGNGISYSFDWRDQQLVIEIQKDIPDTERALPGIKFQIEKSVEKDLYYILLRGIERLVIDSRTTGKEFIEKHPSVINSVFGLTSSLKRTNSILTRDLKSVIITYSLDMYPFVAELFIPNTRPSPVTPLLQFIPSSDFTGIVIYVDQLLPLYGKEGKDNFTPSLFPRIFDENLNLVAGPLMADPASVKEYGTVGYRQITDLSDIKRIGQNPLKMRARGLFGINNTDIIISHRDAELILSRENNIDLITKGKIVIIYNQVD